MRSASAGRRAILLTALSGCVVVEEAPGQEAVVPSFATGLPPELCNRQWNTSFTFGCGYGASNITVLLQNCNLLVLEATAESKDAKKVVPPRFYDRVQEPRARVRIDIRDCPAHSFLNYSATPPLLVEGPFALMWAEVWIPLSRCTPAYPCPHEPPSEYLVAAYYSFAGESWGIGRWAEISGFPAEYATFSTQRNMNVERHEIIAPQARFALEVPLGGGDSGRVGLCDAAIAWHVIRDHNGTDRRWSESHCMDSVSIGRLAWASASMGPVKVLAGSSERLIGELKDATSAVSITTITP